MSQWNNGNGTVTPGVVIEDGAGNKITSFGGGSGGGSGGAATIADGADVAQGTTTDAAGASTIMGQIKAAAVSLAAILAKLIAGVPVTGAFFQATQPVSAAALPLPAGAATSALQPALNGDGGALAHVTNFPATQPVSAAALPLPAGAATSAAQAALLTALGTPAQAGATVPTTETYANVAASAAPVSVGQAATLIVAARTGRKEVTLILEAAVALRVGGSGVGASANGVLIQGVAGEALTISGGAAVYGYAPTGTAIVSALEVF